MRGPPTSPIPWQTRSKDLTEASTRRTDQNLLVWVHVSHGVVSTARPDISAFDLRPGVKAIVTVAGPPEGFDPAEITVRHFLDGVCQ